MYNEMVKEYSEAVGMGVGQRIQEMRLERKMSGADLGAYLNVSANQISRIETGKATCKIEHIYIICQVLECSADYILFGNKKEEINEYQKACLDALIKSFK